MPHRNKIHSPGRKCQGWTAWAVWKWNGATCFFGLPIAFFCIVGYRKTNVVCFTQIIRKCYIMITAVRASLWKLFEDMGADDFYDVIFVHSVTWSVSMLINPVQHGESRVLFFFYEYFPRFCTFVIWCALPDNTSKSMPILVKPLKRLTVKGERVLWHLYLK